MIDIDKMVEVVAENIVKVGKDRLYDPQYDTAWAGKIPDDVLHKRKMKLARIYAKAAIKSFCKGLPQLNKEDYDDLAQYYNESKLYQDLLEYGKDA